MVVILRPFGKLFKRRGKKGRKRGENIMKRGPTRKMGSKTGTF